MIGIAYLIIYIVNANSLSSFKQLSDEHWTDYHYFLMIDIVNSMWTWFVCEHDSQAMPFSYN